MLQAVTEKDVKEGVHFVHKYLNPESSAVLMNSSSIFALANALLQV